MGYHRPWILATLLFFVLSCQTEDPPPHGMDDDDADDPGDDDDGSDDDDDASSTGEFPEFITPNDEYFVTRIGAVPEIQEDSYCLFITGLIDNPVELTLADLQMLPATGTPVTLECIGNSSTGKQLGTALWEGFLLHDLLAGLGIGANATHARFDCGDGFWATLSLEQIEDHGVIGALRMNGEELPAEQGYPLRVVLPGYYGVKHPAWVTGIELVDTPTDDYYEVSGWDCSPPMPVDSKFFFPGSGADVHAGVPFQVGGAAFGGTRVSKVEVTTDGGGTWTPAEIVQEYDMDHVWKFWQATLTLSTPGDVDIHARATDTQGNTQPQDDPDSWDGVESWPRLRVDVIE